MQVIEQKVVLVTRATRLAGLRKKFSTPGQAKFYLERAAEQDMVRRQAAPDAAAHPAPVTAPQDAFEEYEREDQVYQDAVNLLRRELQDLLHLQVIDRELVPNYLFAPSDVVVTVGQDGLVANVAKYAVGRPIVAVNPDPQRIDGILLPFRPEQARQAVQRALGGRAKMRQVTLAETLLNDGQRLLAFNDFFVGARTHVSARYRIEVGRRSEPHISSGVIVSTGAGSTGWLSSIFNMVSGIAGHDRRQPPLKWEDRRLVFVVREPFLSKSSQATIVSGHVEPGTELVIESRMPSSGVIFSDGVEQDFLAFNSGTIARIRAAQEQALLVV